MGLFSDVKKLTGAHEYGRATRGELERRGFDGELNEDQRAFVNACFWADQLASQAAEGIVTASGAGYRDPFELLARKPDVQIDPEVKQRREQDLNCKREKRTEGVGAVIAVAVVLVVIAVVSQAGQTIRLASARDWATSAHTPTKIETPAPTSRSLLEQMSEIVVTNILIRKMVEEGAAPKRILSYLKAKGIRPTGQYKALVPCRYLAESRQDMSYYQKHLFADCIDNWGTLPWDDEAFQNTRLYTPGYTPREPLSNPGSGCG